MVLRRPYAFLIKHFKKIHLVLFFIMLYITYKGKNLLDFYNGYLSNKVSLISSNDYISFLLYFVIILTVIILFAVYYLMRYKKKPRLTYILLMIGYLALLIVFIYAKSNLKILEVEVIDTKTVRLVRDIVRIAYWAQVLSLFPILVRALGFNIKKFDFDKDLVGLNATASDSEEVEVNINVNTHIIEQKSRRQLRELKYYYKENKAFLNIIFAVIFIILTIFIVIKISTSDKIYKEKNIIDTNYMNFSIENSYIRTTSDDGRVIVKNNNVYLLVNMNVKSKYDNNYVIDTNKFILKIKDNTYLPTKKYYDSFKEMGIGYRKQTLSYENYNNYILVYSIPENYRKSEMIIRYDDAYDKIYRIKLNPVNGD